MENSKLRTDKDITTGLDERRSDKTCDPLYGLWKGVGEPPSEAWEEGKRRIRGRFRVAL